MPRRHRFNPINNLKAKQNKDKTEIEKEQNASTVSSGENKGSIKVDSIFLNTENISVTIPSNDETHTLSNKPVETVIDIPTLQIDMKRPVLASYHQGNPLFGRFSGSQCVAMSAMSMLFTKVKPLESWNRADLDNILIAGNELYASLQSMASINKRYILVSELPEKIEKFGKIFSLSIADDSYVGLFWSRNASGIDDIVMNLFEALQTSLLMHESCFVTFGGNTFAIMKHLNTFFIFDSHSRSDRGMISENGRCILLHVRDITQVYQHCNELAVSMNLGPQTQFEITGINIDILTDLSTPDIPQSIDRECVIVSDDNNMSCNGPFNDISIDLAESNDDIIISQVESNSFSFNPISLATKSNICSQLGLSANSIENIVSTCPLTKPSEMKSIIGDGNCFFRSISYALTGTENHHRKIRLAVVKHLKTHAALFKQYLRSDYTSVLDYITRSRMNYVKSWASEIEIFAAADLLETDIYTYSNNNWLKFSRLQHKGDNSMNEAIYINHLNEIHYEVVIDVMRDVPLVQEQTYEVSNDCNASDYEQTANVQYTDTKNETEILFKHDSFSQSKSRKRKRCTKFKRNAVSKTQIIKKSNNLIDEQMSEISNDYDKQPLHELDDITNDTFLDQTAPYHVRNRKRGNRWKSHKLANKSKNIKEKQQYDHDRYMSFLNEPEESKDKYCNLYKNDRSFKRRVKSILKVKSKERYRGDAKYRNKIKERSKEHIKDQYKNNPVFTNNIKQRSAFKYRTNVNHRNLVKQLSILKYRTSINHRNRVKRLSTDKYMSNINHRNRVKQLSTDKYRININHRNRVKQLSSDKYRTDKSHKNKIIDQNKQRKFKKQIEMSDIEKVHEEFKKEASYGPEYICCVCHRLLFKNQVNSCNEKFYNKDDKVKKVATHCITKTYLHECSIDCIDNCDYPEGYKALWICFTCDSKIKSGKIPAESVKNNLDPGLVPKQLECLNSLEAHLIALNIPFMKMVNLAKTKQFKVSGETVCIPNNINEVTKVLPRSESSDQLIRLKLKKRITHKSYYQYEFVSKTKLRDALLFLKENNQYYTEVEFDKTWNFETDIEGKGDNSNLEQLKPDTLNNSDTLENETDSLPDIDMPLDELHGLLSPVALCNSKTRQDDTDSLPDIDMPLDELHGPLLSTCLQPVDLAQDILDNTDSIFSISPTENKNPVRILTDKTNEALCFPTLFPTGQNTFSDNRDERITLGRYLHCRLMNVDNRFAKNTDYIFYAQYLYELSQVVSSVSIALRKTKSGGNRITADMLTNEEPLKNILKCDDGYRFLKSVRGSPSYWKTTQSDLFAMIRQLGVATYFISFSSAELRWSSFIEVILRQQGDNRKASDLDWAEKQEILRSNPITIARMFDHRFHYFLKNFIMSKAEPIGKVKDYFYRIEYQMRGSCHVHGLLWIEDAPVLGRDPDSKLVEFVDKYITCKMPNISDDPELHEIVSSVQTHSKKHSKSCKKKNTVCRFNFPRPPSEETFVCRTVDMDKSDNQESRKDEISNDQAKTILECIMKAISDPDKNYDSFEDLYTDLDITQELFVKACEKLTKKNNLVLKRDPKDVWINQYNPDLLRAWNANLDIQYVFDAYSCIVYIVSYISKSEREIGLLLGDAHKEAVEGNLDAKSSLKKISSTYLHSREVSAQEAAYRVCNLRLKEASRKVVFIPTGENNIRMTLPLSILKSRANEGTLTDDNMYQTSIVDRYRARPDGIQFDYMCIAQFCSEYRVMAKSEKIDVDRENNPAYKLKGDLGYIIKRTKTSPAVIRYARFSITKNPELFYLSSLQLFLPYRQTEQLKPPPLETYEDFYKFGSVRYYNDVELVREIVNNNREKYEKDAVNIEMAQEILEKCGPLDDAWANICVETEVDRLECIELQGNETINEDDDPVEIPDLLGNRKSDKKDRHKEKCDTVISHSQAIPLLRSLNKLQSQVFYKVRQFCLDKIHNKNPEQFMLFLTGGAGSGKSHIIKCIYYEASRLLARISDSPDDTTVAIIAPTGVSAFNISSSTCTIHSLFCLPIHITLPYIGLSSDKVNTLRSKLGNLEILIIDEISMVDHKLLCYIHGRLRQIKQTPDHVLFGNVSIIAVGDFYQLPPVKGRPLYNDNEIINLWQDNFKIVQLTEIMRQRDDLTFAQALNRIRTKKNSDEMSVDDINLFSSRVTGEESDAVHIVSTNKQVNEINLKFLHSKCPDTITIAANDYSKDARTGKMKKLEKYLTRNVDSSLPNELVIGIDARVMLIKNLNVSDGLANGSFGKVTYITVDNDKPKIIYVKFDDERVGAILRRENKRSNDDIPEGSTPIEIQEEKVNYRGDIRRQFPLKLSYSTTVHKVQGLSLRSAVVSLKKIFSPGQAYVALSRVTSLEGLIIRDFDEKVIYCDPRIEESIHKMPLYLEPQVENRRNTEILLFNVEGLMQHHEDLKNDYRFIQTDFICLTETWISQIAECRNFQLEGYTLFNQPRHTCYDNSNVYDRIKSMKNGGVGIYYSNKRHCNIHRLGTFNIEHVVFSISDINLTVVVIYRPSCYKADLFISNLQILLTELENYGGDMIVMGDFNQNLLDGNSTIARCMSENGFTQLVNFVTTTGGTLLDLVFVKYLDQSKVHLNLVSTYFSYHECIRIGLND
ncbi:hypothetical protein SNE40_021119 [Patella caerulea]|uniref:ATP-dependent DNA helicase n=1 Tax=Patella caerulea TaxID=87958 RepID=A0AAN8GC88_PATCE